MFAKVYSYTLKSDYFDEWQEITTEANALYTLFGKIESKTFVKEKDGACQIIEIGVYNSRKHFVEVKESVDNTDAIKSLFKRFARLVDVKKVEQDEYTMIQ